MAETRKTRQISRLKTVRHEFEKFPEGARLVCLTALTIAAEGGKADLAFRGDAFRVVYALQLGPDIWAIHASQKKSTMGIKTPKREIDLVKGRLEAA